MDHRVLVSGASIARLGTALRPHRTGSDVTIVEWAPSFRAGRTSTSARRPMRSPIRAVLGRLGRDKTRDLPEFRPVTGTARS